jgi:zinc protease
LLVIVGDISAAEAQAEAEQVFGDWESGDVPDFLDYPEAELGDTSLIYLVDRPTSEQATVQVGNRAINARAPERYALSVINTVLGGGSSSRLYTNLREDKGYTYGARSGFNYRRSAGPFTVRAGVRTDVTAPAVTEIFKELRRMSEDPITADEFSLARDSIVLSLPGRFETTSQAVSSYANVFIYDLGTDYYTRLPALYSGATLEGVRGVARKYLAPEKMIVVAAGDRARIEPELRKLNLGPVEIRDADGNAPKP